MSATRPVFAIVFCVALGATLGGGVAGGQLPPCAEIGAQVAGLRESDEHMAPGATVHRASGRVQKDRAQALPHRSESGAAVMMATSTGR
jgi:hypothetical protein